MKMQKRTGLIAVVILVGALGFGIFRITQNPDKYQKQEEQISVALDCSKFSRISTKELITELGEPKETDNWNNQTSKGEFQMQIFTYDFEGFYGEFILYEDNLEAARDFFITYFNAKSNARYHNVQTGFYSYFLSFEHGARLEIMNKPDIADMGNKTSRMGYAHIAFSVGSAGKVNQLTDKLRANGYTVSSEPRTTGDGYYESCILDLEGNQIEITV